MTADLDTDASGQWLFHCHMLQHMIPPIVPKVPGLSMQTPLKHPNEHLTMHEATGMGQLVVGITVPESAQAGSDPTWHADRKLQLEIRERGGTPR